MIDQNRLIYCLRYLPFNLPSRRKDSAWTIACRTVPYVVGGTAVLTLVSAVSPAERHLIPIWLANVKALPDWSQKLVHTLLTGVWLWSAAYAIGVMTIEKLRRYYRKLVVRPIEKAFCVE